MRIHQNSIKSLFQRKKSSADNEKDGASSSSPRPIPQLSPIANSVVSRCSKILKVPTQELQHHFDIELPESVKQLFTYARNFLEFCSFQAIHQLMRHPDYLSDPEFRRLTYDMMLAWESPSVESESQHKCRKLFLAVARMQRMRMGGPSFIQVLQIWLYRFFLVIFFLYACKHSSNGVLGWQQSTMITIVISFLRLMTRKLLGQRLLHG